MFWFGVILLITSYALVGILWARPMLTADSAAGFRVWDCMQSGTAWNVFSVPDPQNIAIDHEGFLTWWSPGQYVPVGLLSLTGLSLGISIIVVTYAGVLAGLVGCWKLFVAWGFPESVVMISVAIIALGWHTSVIFGIFNGGELALFAGFPWIAWILMKLVDRPVRLSLAIPPLFLFGAFLKLSFPLVALCLCAGLWLGRSRKPWVFDTESWHIIFGLITAFSVFYVILWLVFLSQGSTPGTAGGSSISLPLILGFSATGPIMATGAFDSLISRAVFFPGASILLNWEQLGWVLCILAIPAGALYFMAYRFGPTDKYRGMLMSFIVGYILLFTWLYFRGASVSTEDRHFRPAAIVLIPGLVQVFFIIQKTWLRNVLAGMALLAVAYGLVGFTNRALYIFPIDNVGSRGFTQHRISPAATKLLQKLKQSKPDSITFTTYVTAPEVALELPKNRIILTHAEHETTEKLQAIRYQGRVANLLIVTSIGMKPEQITAILLSFESYDPTEWNFRGAESSGFYYQGDWLDSMLHGQPKKISNH